MAVLNYEGLSFFYTQMIAHFASIASIDSINSTISSINNNLNKAISKIKVGDTVIEGSFTEPLKFEGGNVTLTPNAENKSISFNVSDSVYHTGNIIASSTEPANPTEGMIWLKI